MILKAKIYMWQEAMPTFKKKLFKNNFVLHIINLQFTLCILFVLIIILRAKSLHVVAVGNAYCIILFRH